MLGCTTSYMTATGDPPATSVRHTDVQGSEGSRPSASHTSAPTARCSMRTSTADSCSPRRAATEE